MCMYFIEFVRLGCIAGPLRSRGWVYVDWRPSRTGVPQQLCTRTSGGSAFKSRHLRATRRAIVGRDTERHLTWLQPRQPGMLRLREPVVYVHNIV